MEEKEIKKENVFKGIIGGLIGSLAGVLAIVLFSKLGYIASVAGLIMAVCTIKLYEKFAGSIGKKGIISCIVIMIIMTIVAENTSFTVKYPGYGFLFMDCGIGYCFGTDGTFVGE